MVVLRVAPFLSRVVVIVRRALVLLACYYLACRGAVAPVPLAHRLNALVHVGSYEDVHHSLHVSKHIVGATPHEDARALLGRLPYRVTLKLEQTLLREIALVEVVVADVRRMHVEQRAQETPLFVVLLEHLLRETALLSRKVEQLLVVELASKLLRKNPRDFSSARTELSSDVYN